MSRWKEIKFQKFELHNFFDKAKINEKRLFTNNTPFIISAVSSSEPSACVDGNNSTWSTIGKKKFTVELSLKHCFLDRRQRQGQKYL